MGVSVGVSEGMGVSVGVRVAVPLGLAVAVLVLVLVGLAVGVSVGSAVACSMAVVGVAWRSDRATGRDEVAQAAIISTNSNPLRRALNYTQVPPLEGNLPFHPELHKVVDDANSAFPALLHLAANRSCFSLFIVKGHAVAPTLGKQLTPPSVRHVARPRTLWVGILIKVGRHHFAS